MLAWSVLFPLKLSSLTKFLCLTDVKGILAEVWFGDNMTTLEDVQLEAALAIPQTLELKQNYFPVSFRATPTTAGFRMRTFFLCSLTGIYEFYFSCFGACEWFIKESEDEEVNITAGSSLQGMEQQQFKE